MSGPSTKSDWPVASPSFRLGMVLKRGGGLNGRRPEKFLKDQ